jgi:hypothetical protein
MTAMAVSAVLFIVPPVEQQPSALVQQTTICGKREVYFSSFAHMMTRFGVVAFGRKPDTTQV